MAQRKIPPVPGALIEHQLDQKVSELEASFSADVLYYCGPIRQPADQIIRVALESRRGTRQRPRRKRLAFILTTEGGYIEIAERIADTLRQHYNWVSFVVPDQAMSAGTVLAMSGDEIYMDYFSRVGPIDPQVERPEGKRGLIPALGYLEQYERLIEKSRNGTLTSGEAAILMQNFDLGELYHYEQARNLSITLLEDWLVRYKFKNWKRTEKHGRQVTLKMKRNRAKEIAEKLNNIKMWHSHARGISMEVLTRRLKLRIENLSRHAAIYKALKDYHYLLTNYMATINMGSAIHTHGWFLPLMR